MCVLRHRLSIYFMIVNMGFLPLKCQRTINRLKVDMPVWLVCLWILRSTKQKQMWLIKWFSVTLLLMNNWYQGTALGETRHKVLDLSTSVMFPFPGQPTFSSGSSSTGTGCSASFWFVSLSDRGLSCCSSVGGRCDLTPSCFGATWTTTGLTLATMATERGLVVRPRWTVSQPSASFLPGKHERYRFRQGWEDVLLRAPR